MNANWDYYFQLQLSIQSMGFIQKIWTQQKVTSQNIANGAKPIRVKMDQ